MPKYYIKSGTLEIIYSINKSPIEACCKAIDETNEHDTLDEYFYADERGFRNYKNAQSDTYVIETETVMDMAGWTIE